MQRIILSATNDISTDQRVERMCDTFQSLGFEVIVIGRKLPRSFPLQRPYKTRRMQLVFNKGFLFYAEYNIRLFFKLLFTQEDILWANDLDTLPSNYLVSRIKNRKLVFDSHELFTEIPELINKPFVKRFWERIERLIVPKLKNVITVSGSIADYYREKYEKLFIVIRNLPSVTGKKVTGNFPFDHKGRSIMIYQGALNVGRGLELMIQTMPLLKNAILIIIGDGDIGNSLKQQVANMGLTNTVFFLGRILPEDLKSLTPLADIGISLEEDMSLNYRFALPNKLFDYVAAKIPVIVSDLPEIKQIVQNYDIGNVLKTRTPEALAKLIDDMITKGKNHWEEPLKKASQELNWENESKKLEVFMKNLK